MFKIGDKVRIIKRFPENDSGCGRGTHIGEIGIITETGVAGTCFNPAQFKGNPHYVVWETANNNYYGMFVAEELESIKPMNIKYILSYDTPNRDPIEYFEKLSEVEEKIKQLTRSNGILLDTIQVFEVKKVGKVRGIKINIAWE